ncbi:XRE family transcriptional regulator [Photorhabdus khanii]|uniref:Transcriptional regulator n=1 Tax=Photorhabdus khanii subsp. guanajuatensis TaxID=2100166 RepID=A0A4R4IMN6_9GAMM|nr:helix-turn-helix transcriptional regulator [Photorhabdus khanii]TDB41642.1 transcriptional regulator [Photorhabdus khanii subsp. guanajuatensis]
MSVGEKIRSLRLAKGMTILELATATGGDVGNISRLERGLQGYSDASLRKIAEALDVKLSDLFFDDDPLPMPEIIKHSTKKYYKVSALDIETSIGLSASTGDFIETIGSIEFTIEEARKIFDGCPASTIKVITVRGDSMSGTIESGDQIFIDQSVNHFEGDGIYIFTFGRSFHIKRLQMVKNKLAVLSDNSKYKDWFINENEESELSIHGKVLISQSMAYRRHS